VYRVLPSQSIGSCVPFEPLASGKGAGEPIAVAFTKDDAAVIQSREPAMLILPESSETIPLSSDSREDTGHAVFHANAGAMVACASCHLEGGEDGRVWRFQPAGLRRTQSLRGGVLATAPFHWAGDQVDFTHLMGEVFVRRMGGAPLEPDVLMATARWVDRIPALPAVALDPSAIERGRALFEDRENVGCTTCHGGITMTSNATLDVGTGGAFQVPSLRGVGWRDPFLHDGRAKTLAGRFTPSGGGDQHGHTSQLSATQIQDLTTYLLSL
jgi:mono/diheme cytochrome c family protein